VVMNKSKKEENSKRRKFKKKKIQKEENSKRRKFKKKKIQKEEISNPGLLLYYIIFSLNIIIQ
jgi:hypothetical protein